MATATLVENKERLGKERENSSERLYSIEKLAKLIGVSVSAITKWTNDGLLEQTKETRNAAPWAWEFSTGSIEDLRNRLRELNRNKKRVLRGNVRILVEDGLPKKMGDRPPIRTRVLRRPGEEGWEGWEGWDGEGKKDGDEKAETGKGLPIFDAAGMVKSGRNVRDIVLELLCHDDVEIEISVSLKEKG